VVCLEYFACLLCSAPLFSKETQMVRLEELAVAAGKWEVGGGRSSSRKE
jgi:hypothetical protein